METFQAHGKILDLSTIKYFSNITFKVNPYPQVSRHFNKNGKKGKKSWVNLHCTRILTSVKENSKVNTKMKNQLKYKGNKYKHGQNIVKLFCHLFQEESRSSTHQSAVYITDIQN